MKQSQFFIDKEGDRWFERNKPALGQRDPISKAIKDLRLKPKQVLEIGCSNGWRLAALRDEYGCAVTGLDPSQAASEDAKKSRVSVWTATAAAMPLRSHAYDLVIYGFCLYLTDPEDWFRIAMEGDRVLADDGHMVIHDFNTGNNAFRRSYEHAEGLFSYHVQFSKLWLAHPWYHRVLGRQEGPDEQITVLKKRQFIPVMS